MTREWIIKNALKFVDRIVKALQLVTIEGQEIRIKCPEERGVYSASVAVNQAFWQKGRIIKFPFPQLRRIDVRSMPSLSSEQQAVRQAEVGFEIVVSSLTKADLFLLDFEFDLGGQDFLDSLVHRDQRRDSYGDDHDEYWMHAQLKHLDGLRTQYGVVDLRDVDFLVDVGIHQDVKTSIPRPFVERMETAAKLLHEKQRDRKMKLAREHLRQGTTAKTNDDLEVLQGVQDMFRPARFRRFFTLTESFRYADVLRGTEFYDSIPFPTFPKVMTVVSRTDLSYDQPAVEGVLRYSKRDFQGEIMKLFPKSMRKASELD